MQRLGSILSFSILLITSVVAQRVDNSPYSRFGIGNIFDQNFQSVRLMGGVGSAHTDPYHANFLNPASISFLNATAFEVGVSMKRSTISDDVSSATQWGGNLEYIAIAFPLKNPINQAYERIDPKYKLAMGFALFQNSKVNYDITSNEISETFGAFQRQYLGTGGSYKAQWTNSVKYKNFSLGLNLGYMFGKISYERNLLFTELTQPFNNAFTDDYTLRGGYWNMGLIYSTVINRSKLKDNQSVAAQRISIGIRGGLSSDFSTESNQFAYAFQRVAANSTISDTIYERRGIEGSGRLPAEIGLGIQYFYGEKFMIGFDASQAYWSNYENDATGEQKNTFQNSMNMSLGGFYRPDYKSFNRYFKRVFYRYGFYYKQDPRIVGGEGLTDIGVTAGFGFPFIFQRRISNANLGISYGKFGRGSLIEENYLKIHFGFTFNDEEWFIKRKYN